MKSPQTSQLPKPQDGGELVPHVVLGDSLALHVVVGSLLEVVAKCDASDLNEDKLRLISSVFLLYDLKWVTDLKEWLGTYTITLFQI